MEHTLKNWIWSLLHSMRKKLTHSLSHSNIFQKKKFTLTFYLKKRMALSYCLQNMNVRSWTLLFPSTVKEVMKLFIIEMYYGIEFCMLALQVNLNNNLFSITICHKYYNEEITQWLSQFSFYLFQVPNISKLLFRPDHASDWKLRYLIAHLMHIKFIWIKTTWYPYLLSLSN